MEKSENATSPEVPASQTDKSNGNASLYILIVMSFYGVFLCGIMLGYLRCKRREKRRSNVFTRLVHEEEQREWGALRRKRSTTLPAIPGLCAMQVPGGHDGHREGRVLSPLACVLCSMEQSSLSSLCSSGEVRFAIEEESDSGTAEEEALKGSPEHSDDSAVG